MAPLLRKEDVGNCCLDELVEQVFQVLLATGADGGLTVVGIPSIKRLATNKECEPFTLSAISLGGLWY